MTSAETLPTPASPQANGGAQDNGSSSITFTGTPTGPVQWQLGVGGDGFYARIDPVGTGSRVFASGRATTAVRFIAVSVTAPIRMLHGVAGYPAGWGGDTQSFTLPYDLFHGGIPGGDDCPAAGVPGGCGISLPARLGCGKQFMAATLRLARRTGT